MGGKQSGTRFTGMCTSLKTSRDDGPEATVLCHLVKAFAVSYVNIISIERGGAVHGNKKYEFWSAD